MGKIEVTRDVIISERGCNFLYDHAKQYDVEIEMSRYYGEFRVKVTGEPDNVERIFNALYKSVQ